MSRGRRSLVRAYRGDNVGPTLNALTDLNWRGVFDSITLASLPARDRQAQYQNLLSQVPEASSALRKDIEVALTRVNYELARPSPATMPPASYRLAFENLKISPKNARERRESYLWLLSVIPPEDQVLRNEVKEALDRVTDEINRQELWEQAAKLGRIEKMANPAKDKFIPSDFALALGQGGLEPLGGSSPGGPLILDEVSAMTIPLVKDLPSIGWKVSYQTSSVEQDLNKYTEARDQKSQNIYDLVYGAWQGVQQMRIETIGPGQADLLLSLLANHALQQGMASLADDIEESRSTRLRQTMTAKPLDKSEYYRAIGKEPEPAPLPRRKTKRFTEEPE